MHVIIKDQSDPAEESILCIERNAQSAIILRGDYDRLDDLVRIAASMKVPKVYLIVDADSVTTFEEVGWKVAPNRVLLEKTK